MCFGSRKEVDEDVSVTSAVPLPYLPPGGSTQSATTSIRASSHGLPTSTIPPKPTQSHPNPRQAQIVDHRARWQMREARGQAETASFARRSEPASRWSPHEQVKPLIARKSLSSLPDKTKRPSLQQMPSNQNIPPPPKVPLDSTRPASQPMKSKSLSPMATAAETAALTSSNVSAQTNAPAGRGAEAAAVDKPPSGILHSRTRSTGSPRPRPVDDRFKPLSEVPRMTVGSVPAAKDKEEGKSKPGLKTTTRPVSSSSSISKASTVSSVSLDADDHAIIRKAAVKSALRSMLTGGNDSNSSSDIDPEMVVLFMRKRAQKEAKQAEKVRAKREAKRKRNAQEENNGPKDFRARVQELRKQRTKEKAEEDAAVRRAKKPLREDATSTQTTMPTGNQPVSSSTSMPGGVERSKPLGVLGDLLEYKRLEENKKNTRERLGRFAGPALEPITFKQFLEKKAREDALRALLQGVPDSGSSSSESSEEDTSTSLTGNRLVRPAAASTTKLQEGPRLKVPASVSASKITTAPTSAQRPDGATVPKGEIATPELRNKASVSSTMRKSTTGPVFKVPPLPEFQKTATAPNPLPRQNVPPKYLPDLRLDISIRGPDAPGAMSAADISEWRRRLSGNRSADDIARLRSDILSMVGSWTSAEWPTVTALIVELRKTMMKAQNERRDRTRSQGIPTSVARKIGAF